MEVFIIILYKPERQFMEPNEMVLDPTIENKFSVLVNGTKCIGYRFSVYDAADALVEKASTEKTLLETPLYNDDSLEITVAADAFAAGNEYKWQIALYANDITATSVDIEKDTITVANHNLNNGDMVYISSTDKAPAPLEAYKVYYVHRVDKDTIAVFEYLEGAKNDAGRIDLTDAGAGEITVSSIAISDQIPFSVYDIPKLTLEVPNITSRIHDFIPVYSHPQNIPVNHYKVIVYDGGAISDETEDIYSSNIKYHADGLLTGGDISIEFVATNDIGQVCTTGKIPLTVSYDVALLDIKPIAENNHDKSAIELMWDRLVQIIGETTGRIHYQYDFMNEGNIALKLFENATLTFNGINVLASGSPPLFAFSPERNFTGPIFRLNNSQNPKLYYEVGYDGSHFYRNINGVFFYENAMELDYNKVYLVACLQDSVYVREIGSRVPQIEE